MMQRRRFVFLVFASVALLLSAGAGQAVAAVRVVATVPDLAAIAREVGGPAVIVSALALPTQDPHFVDARPHLALDLSKADLVLAIGLDLEVGWLPVLLTGSRNPKILPGARGYLDCSTLVRLLDIPVRTVDRSMGDVHPGGNPHYLFDPRNAPPIARGVAARLAELDPANGAAYRARAEELTARLEAARAGWEKRLAPFRGAAIIGFHRSWVYLAGWVGLVEVEFLEPKPGIPPSPAHLARILPLARSRGVRFVLQEDFYPDSTATLFSTKIGAALVRMPGGTNFAGGQTYLQHIEEIVARLESAAKGKS